MSIAPQFVCLSMIVNSRAWNDCPNLSWMDCLAYAIRCEDGDEPMPPLVERTARDALRYAEQEGIR